MPHPPLPLSLLQELLLLPVYSYNVVVVAVVSVIVVAAAIVV